MSQRWFESPGNVALIATLSADQAPTAIIGCPHPTVPRAGIAGVQAEGRILPT